MRHSLLTVSFRERATRVKDVRSAHAGFRRCFASLTPAARSRFSLPRAEDEISTDTDTDRRSKPNQPSELEQAERNAPLT